jgi:hypothetical protein
MDNNFIFLFNKNEDIKAINLSITILKALENVRRINKSPKGKNKKGKTRNLPEEKLYCNTEIKIPAELVARTSVSHTRRLPKKETRKTHKTSYITAKAMPNINA